MKKITTLTLIWSLFLMAASCNDSNSVTPNKQLQTIPSTFSDQTSEFAFDFLKKFSFLQKSQAYETKIKDKIENDIKQYEESLKKQKEELMNLILKAEEKLKHENRKKVQTRLKLDQIVLRSVSALNMQALSLSQNSLNGKINQ